MKRKHRTTLEKLFVRPVSGTIRWTIEEREGSRIAVILFDSVKVFHMPHPEPTTDKGAVASIRKWLEENGVKP